LHNSNRIIMADRLPPPNYGQSLRTPSTDQHQQQQNSDSTEISGRQRKLWSLFQHTATSLTHLYKCKSKSDQQHQHQAAAEDQESWIAFQSAAASLTSLYRESADILASVESKHHHSSPSERSSTVVTSDLSTICNSNSSSPMPPPVSSISRNSSSKTGSGEFAKTMPINNCESVFTADALFGTTDHHQTSPTNQTFDFLTANHHHGTCRLKRSWSPSRWPDDDMDHLGAKKRRFF